jgi:hypothetical protein
VTDSTIYSQPAGQKKSTIYSQAAGQKEQKEEQN